jgi:tRNA threonylcarbamoyladenosine modification (KEOPS) complex  Pcc1 subunit
LNRINIEIEFPLKSFQGLSKVIAPDLAENMPRSKILMQETASDLHIYIEANDIVAARASLASVARQVVLFSKLEKEVN